MLCFNLLSVAYTVTCREDLKHTQDQEETQEGLGFLQERKVGEAEGIRTRTQGLKPALAILASAVWYKNLDGF